MGCGRTSGSEGPCSRSALVQVAGIQQRGGAGGTGGRGHQPRGVGGRGGSSGKVLKRFILMCCGGRVILQEAACIKISRPVDWSVTVICGSSPEVMGSNWARGRRPDRLPSSTGGGPGGRQDLLTSTRGGPFSAFNLASQPVTSTDYGRTLWAPGDTAWAGLAICPLTGALPRGRG